MNKSIAILYICTGQYSVFWNEFFESCEKFFLNDYEKHYFVFTDNQNLTEINYENIHIIQHEAEPWPYASLKRYQMFLSIEEQLQKFTFIFFFNANSEFRKKISADMILPREELHEDLTVVLHPGFASLPNIYREYDRNPESHAFIPYGFGKVYIVGGVNGGTADAFLKMCKVLNNNIEKDLKKGIIALWHDESYINQYIWKYQHYRVLPPSYVFPCSWGDKLPYEHIIDMRAKEKYLNVEAIKADSPKSEIKYRYQLMNKVMLKIAKKIYEKSEKNEESHATAI